MKIKIMYLSAVSTKNEHSPQEYTKLQCFPGTKKSLKDSLDKLFHVGQIVKNKSILVAGLSYDFQKIKNIFTEKEITQLRQLQLSKIK